MAISVQLQVGKLPDGYCFTSPQNYMQDIFALVTATVSGAFSGVIIGANPPGVSDQDKAWIKTDATGRPIGIYLYRGQWVWPHPSPPLTSERRIWAGVLTGAAGLYSFDGGDGTDPTVTPPTDTTGAMWQFDAAFQFQIPVGAGTNLAGGYNGNPATTINQGQNAGAEQILLDPTTIPAHQHELFTPEYLSDSTNTDITATDVVARGCNRNSGGADGYRVKAGTPGTPPSVGLSQSIGGGLYHNNMPPVLGVYFIQRTARKYFVGG